jgi:salicylate biosynthesis isochorismate synthase
MVGLARPAQLGSLLRLGPEPLSVSWSNPHRGVHAAGLGVAGDTGRRGACDDVVWLGAAPAAAPPGPWFGGWAFDARRPWSGFEPERWVLPEVLAWWDGKGTWLAAFGPAGTSAEQLEARLARVECVEPTSDEPLAAMRVGDRAQWDQLIADALAAIDEGMFEKVVCARVIDVEAASPWSERRVLKALEARHPQCWTFLVRGRDGRAFVGASPETLCETRTADGVLIADALAGTSGRGSGEALLSSDKDRREHAAVVAGIDETLSPFSIEVTHADQPSIRRLANVDHLWTVVTARLLPAFSALEAAWALHPTPAVAGRPRERAVAWLAAHEGFMRGWYTGAVGTFGPAGLTLAVALRAALLEGQRAQVFVGAGVVHGSRSDSEWLETERKALAVLPVLGVHDG